VNSNIDISIIIPMYNCEHFITKCIKSCLNQKLDNYEIIVVNDASTDNGSKVVLKLANKNAKIKLVNHEKNRGLEIARRTGLSNANGKYVTFVDADDWLNKDVLSQHLRIAEEGVYDYVEFATNRVITLFGRSVAKKNIPQIRIGKISQPELFNKYYISFFGVNFLSVNLCGKIFKRSNFTSEILTPFGITMGEDLYLSMKLFPHLKKIYISDIVGYNYRYGGMTSHYNKNLYPDLKKLYYFKLTEVNNCLDKNAKYFADIEIKTVLFDEICQQIRHKIPQEQTISFISGEILLPEWVDILKSWNKSPFTKAIENKDPFLIYKICKSEVRHKWYKEILGFIFNLINLKSATIIQYTIKGRFMSR